MNVIDDFQRKLDRLMREPDNADLYNAIGAMLYRVKDFENAERYLGRAYELDPTDGDVLFNYAVISYRNYAYQNAADACRAGLAGMPEDPALLEMLGDCGYMLGAYDEAAGAYDRLRRVSEKVEAL